MNYSKWLPKDNDHTETIERTGGWTTAKRRKRNMAEEHEADDKMVQPTNGDGVAKSWLTMDGHFLVNV